jgi:hypothetical protein
MARKRDRSATMQDLVDGESEDLRKWRHLTPRQRRRQPHWVHRQKIWTRAAFTYVLAGTPLPDAARRYLGWGQGGLGPRWGSPWGSSWIRPLADCTLAELLSAPGAAELQ